MFLFKTYIDKSSIHGFGVFAAELIPKNSIIWKFEKNVDVKIKENQLRKLSASSLEYLNNFAYLSKKEGGYILCSDNAKYTNHSYRPNMKSIDNISCIAIKDIDIGEEITENYFDFDELAIIKLS